MRGKIAFYLLVFLIAWFIKDVIVFNRSHISTFAPEKYIPFIKFVFHILAYMLALEMMNFIISNLPKRKSNK